MGHKKTAYANLGIFIAIVCVCLFTPSFIKKIASGIFEEFNAPIDYFSSQLKDLQSYWVMDVASKNQLIEAGVALSRLNARNELMRIEYLAMEEKLKRCEELLNLPSFPEYKGEIARVASRDLSAWWQRITIRKGSFHGIKKGSAVIYSKGVVGRVVDVNLYTSVVELVSSRDFRMACHFEGDLRPVVYQGVGAASFHAGMGEVTAVPTDFTASLASPKKLLTSSLAGTFPDGLVVGYVTEFNLEPDQIFKSARVHLSTDLSALTEVLVLIKIEGAAEK